MMSQAVFLVAALVLSGASAFITCKTNTDCSADECCVAESRFHIVSRRQLDDVIRLPWDANSGRCVKYIQEKQSCHYLGFASCGCAPGLKCNYYPEPVPTLPQLIRVPELALSKRKVIFKPGNSFCEKP